MYELDPILKGDPEYREGLREVVAGLGARFPGKVCSYHPQGGRPVSGEMRDASFIGGAVFSVGALGDGPTLALDRAEIVACRGGVTTEVGRKIDSFERDRKCFTLLWSSQNNVVELECGEYTSIPEAAADQPAAEARLIAQHGATFRNLHDIKAGTWRVVPRAAQP